ncbi:hypothetical protein GGR53DRAFT_525566 [Hypoxylon sp. FL1150]|nr:hypothetical protein GGR53DRAFT_525566 [Hypoxylon sp. FL1150]
MEGTLYQGLILFLAVWQCSAAVTWRAIGCDGWSFDGTSMDTIWDNAILMAANAQSAIQAVPTGVPNPFKDEEKRARGNVNFMFGVSSSVMGIDSDGKQALEDARSMYENIEMALRGTLKGFDVNNAFFFCEAHGMTNGIFPGSGKYSMIHIRFVIKVTNGDATAYIVLSYATDAGAKQPCSTEETSKYEARTFTVFQYTSGPPVRFVGVIVCPGRFQEKGKSVVATWPQGFLTVPSRGNKYSSPDDYMSLAGTLIHEITHVVGRTQGRTYRDHEYEFNRCLDLARTRRQDALINPDNYRIYAEMSMSPETRWGAKNPEKRGSGIERKRIERG